MHRGVGPDEHKSCHLGQSLQTKQPFSHVYRSTEQTDHQSHEAEDGSAGICRTSPAESASCRYIECKPEQDSWPSWKLQRLWHWSKSVVWRKLFAFGRLIDFFRLF